MRSRSRIVDLWRLNTQEEEEDSWQGEAVLRILLLIVDVAFACSHELWNTVWVMRLVPVVVTSVAHPPNYLIQINKRIEKALGCCKTQN